MIGTPHKKQQQTTGSGKTLAYLLPLMDDILERKQRALDTLTTSSSSSSTATAAAAVSQAYVDALGYEFARAIILVPNKELVQQVIRMALPLAGGPKALVYGGAALVDPTILRNISSIDAVHASAVSSSSSTNHHARPDSLDAAQRLQHEENSKLVRLAIFPGGLKDPLDFPPFRHSRTGQVPPVDLIVATPATLGLLAAKSKHISMFADIRTLVIDEADMLMDGGYIRSLNQVLMGFRRADKLDAQLAGPPTQHVFVAATLPDSGQKSVDAFLTKRFPTAHRITVPGMHKARHSGLVQATKWMPMDSKKDRMEHLCQLLDTPSTAADQNGLQDEKVMVFLNTVRDVVGATQALIRAGHDAVAFHADLSLMERSQVLEEFRNYQRPATTSNDNNNDNNDVDETHDQAEDTTDKKKKKKQARILVCTDLASRGLDVPGVTAIVQLQFALNVVAHLHRMGRCGRAGQRVGRGFVYYDQKEAPLVEAVRRAEQEQEHEDSSSSHEEEQKDGDQKVGATLTLAGPDVDDRIDDDWDDQDEEDMEGVFKPPRKEYVAGTVNRAFSRKRGFTKKRKKKIRWEREAAEAAHSDETETGSLREEEEEKGYLHQ